MRTEDSLREALEFFEDQAAQLEPEPIRTPVRRLRRAVVLATVAATAAAAVVVPAALHRSAPRPPLTQTPPKPPLKWTDQRLNVYPTGITRASFGSDQSTCQVSESAGSYNLAKLGKLRKKTTVNGHPADLIQVAEGPPPLRVGVVPGTTPEPTTTPAPKTRLMIAWSYQAGRWALARCSPDLGDLDEAERRVQSFADSVVFGPRRLRAPIDFGYLPPGARVQSIDATADFIAFDITKGPTESILVSLSWPPRTHVYTGERPVRVNGRAGRVRVDGELRIPYGTFDLVVHASAATKVDQSAMVLAIAKGIRVADPLDRSTWFPAEVGLSPR